MMDLPHGQNVLARLVRFEFRAGSADVSRHLRDMRLRAHVVLRLGWELIERNHPAFGKRGDIDTMKARYAGMVASKYPTPEEQSVLPEHERVGVIPIAIQNFQHYFILTFPYIFMLIARNYKNLNWNFFLVSNLSLILISGFLFLRIFRYEDVHLEQIKVAKEHEVNFPVGSQVFLLGEIRYLYILNNYHNPVLQEVGYTFDFVPDEEFREKYPVLQLE